MVTADISTIQRKTSYIPLMIPIQFQSFELASNNFQDFVRIPKLRKSLTKIFIIWIHKFLLCLNNVKSLVISKIKALFFGQFLKNDYLYNAKK